MINSLKFAAPAFKQNFYIDNRPQVVNGSGQDKKNTKFVKLLVEATDVTAYYNGKVFEHRHSHVQGEDERDQQVNVPRGVYLLDVPNRELSVRAVNDEAVKEGVILHNGVPN